MTKHIFALAAVLGLTVYLAAEPARPIAPEAPAVHPAAAAALALAFVPSPAPAPAPTPKKTCPCASPLDCTCGAACDCAACATPAPAPPPPAKPEPKIGDQKVTDDPARPWTYGYGREFGYDELGWYRPLKTAPVAQPIRYFAPVMSSFGGCSSGG